MKIYTSKIGPNPLALRHCLALKQLDIETVEVDLIGGENRSEAFLKINPAGQLPCLQLDDGSVIAEVAAIAEYLEELKPDPVLCGNTASQRAETRMRMRQLDYLVLGPMLAGYRHAEGKDFFASRMLLIDEYGPASKRIALEGLKWLNALLEGKSYICGARLTYVDCIAYPLVTFLAQVSLPVPDEMTHLQAYLQRLSEHEIIGQSK